MTQLHVPQNPVRFVTAASLFDGHDASINIMRRILQAQGAEVIHLGHNRSVDEVVTAAIQEDAQGIAVSSYQGGHVEYFSYLVDLLAERGAGHVQVFGGGGGVIVAEEIAILREKGVTIFSPEDGQRLGLAGMINTMIKACDVDLAATPPANAEGLIAGEVHTLARTITAMEAGKLPAGLATAVSDAAANRNVPVLGITGTGGSGKSSLTDELVHRLRLDQQDKLRIAVLAVDPTRRKGGGALLGDRIRMNGLQTGTGHGGVYFRSLATRGAGSEVPDCLTDVITACKAAGYDLVIVETPGIGQGDDAIVPFVDLSLYVMTPEFGAASQLEKIGMLDFADVVAINKFERRGAEDARRDVSRQIARNRALPSSDWEQMPVFGTSAARFNDDGVTALYQYLTGLLAERGLPLEPGTLPKVEVRASSQLKTILPPNRVRYLAEIAETVRGYHATTDKEVGLARQRQQLRAAAELVAGRGGQDSAVEPLGTLADEAEAQLSDGSKVALAQWPATVENYSGEEHVSKVRDREIRNPLYRESLSGTRIPRVALPRYGDEGELLRFLRRENLPGEFPYTAGVFPFKREGEDPARMFAGEGGPARTNRRFHLLAEGQPATRLSTA
ncbi:MAG TPA: cobalamin-dependent protein, partial [Sporichthya sp.]|nr:cobalamin-dependent protein [Sporichthya sp.]